MEEQYNVMMELLQEVIMILDKDGNVLKVNDRLYNWLGYCPNEVIGKNILALSFLTKKSTSRIKEEVLQNLPDSESPCCKLSFINKGGEDRFGDVKFHWIKDEDGNVIRIFMLIYDITEQKELENILLESFERENQAYQQGRLEIIDSVLHNIGNSMNSIIVGIGTIQEYLVNNKFSRYLLSLSDAVESRQNNFGDYVENDPQGQKVVPFIMALADDYAKYNNDMAKIADRVSDMARRVGDIIQMDRAFGTTMAYPNHTNVRKLIHDAIHDFEDVLSEKKIKLITDCDNIPQHISLTAGQVRQAIAGLIKKSIESIEDVRKIKGADYTPFIRIKCYSEYKSVILEITHNGTGIEKNELEEIRQNTYEADKVEKKFNFSSIFKLAHRFGGRMQVSSDGMYEGATIRILLPFKPTLQP